MQEIHRKHGAIPFAAQTRIGARAAERIREDPVAYSRPKGVPGDRSAIGRVIVRVEFDLAEPLEQQVQAPRRGSRHVALDVFGQRMRRRYLAPASTTGSSMLCRFEAVDVPRSVTDRRCDSEPIILGIDERFEVVEHERLVLVGKAMQCLSQQRQAMATDPSGHARDRRRSTTERSSELTVRAPRDESRGNGTKQLRPLHVIGAGEALAREGTAALLAAESRNLAPGIPRSSVAALTGPAEARTPMRDTFGPRTVRRPKPVGASALGRLVVLEPHGTPRRNHCAARIWPKTERLRSAGPDPDRGVRERTGARHKHDTTMVEGRSRFGLR